MWVLSSHRRSQLGTVFKGSRAIPAVTQLYAGTHQHETGDTVTQSDIQSLEYWLSQQIVGQSHLVNRLLIALLADGHLLVEGAPRVGQNQSH